MRKNQQLDSLSELIGCYERHFKSPFPTGVTRGISEGLVSVDETCERLRFALANGRADEKWEQMIPSPGSIEDLLYYQPRLKQLLG